MMRTSLNGDENDQSEALADLDVRSKNIAGLTANTDQSAASNDDSADDGAQDQQQHKAERQQKPGNGKAEAKRDRGETGRNSADRCGKSILSRGRQSRHDKHGTQTARRTGGNERGHHPAGLGGGGAWGRPAGE